MTSTIPLFPLNSVLFPHGVLPLRIFEPRYLDMVSDCLRRESGIGVVLISEGSEVGTAAQPHAVGTLAKIAYWHHRSDGLLGITLKGEQRFSIVEQRVLPNQVIEAQVELLEAPPGLALEPYYAPLATMLRDILQQMEPPYSNMPMQLDDAYWVSARLIELLPFPLAFKQRMLELGDPQTQLDQLHELIQRSKVG